MDKEKNKKILICILAVMLITTLSFCMQPENEGYVSPADESDQNISDYENNTMQDINVTENETEENATVVSIELERPPFI